MSKNMKMIFVLCTVLLLLLSISGCKTKKEGGLSQSDPFVGGTTGLLLSFVNGAPPEEVFDRGEYEFEVLVKVKNKGEYDVNKNDCKIKIKGIKPSDFSLTESDFVKTPEENLLGTRKEAQGGIFDGTTTYVSFPGFNFIGEVAGNTEYPIFAEACYMYGTKVMSQLCIKENLLKEDSEICKVTEEKEVFNSRAPVQIVDFEESARGKDKIAFSFKIVHKGDGDIYSKGTECDKVRSNENKVWVEIDTGIAGTECTGLSGGTATSGYTVLYSKESSTEEERMIFCTQPVTTGVDYVKPANIRLEYDYLEDISTKIIVKPSLT